VTAPNARKAKELSDLARGGEIDRAIEAATTAIKKANHRR
jgi:hypothetical protein